MVLSVLALPVSGQAENPEKDELSVTSLDEIVVTATKTEEKRKDIPNSVIIKDRMDIQESPAISFGDLLGNELGVDWRTYGNYGGALETIKIRGMGADGTQVLVNGLSINSPSLGTANTGKIPLNNIDRIEVVKGSGSLLYGSGAMGGTVNIITKQPKRDKMDLKAGAGYGLNNTYQVSAENGMFTFGDFGYYLTATQQETDGFRDNSDLTHTDASLKLVFDKGEFLDVSLFGDYIDREYGQPGVKPPPATQDYYRNGVKFYNKEAASLQDKGSNEDYHTTLQISSRPVGWLAVSAKGYYLNEESYNYNRNNNDGTGTETWVTNKMLGTEGNLEIKPIEGVSILLGADYKDYDWENEQVDLDANGAQQPATKSTTEADIYTKGFFAEAQYRPCKYFKGLIGIRNEHHSTFGHENIYRYGLVVNPLDKTTIKLNHGSHFKAPTLNDLYWPDGLWTRGNPDLKPETGRHTDATLEQELFNDKLFLTATYFHWDIKDKIGWAENKNYPTLFSMFKWTPTNLNEYEADGFELGAKIGPFYSMILSLNYTYTDAKEEQQGGVARQALYSPNHQFKGNLTYYSDFGLTATTTARFVDFRPAYYQNDTDTEPQYTLSNYWTMDVKVEQRLFEHWILALQANNLFDKGYSTYMANFRDQTTNVTTREYYPGAGQFLFFSVSYEY